MTNLAIAGRSSFAIVFHPHLPSALHWLASAAFATKRPSQVLAKSLISTLSPCSLKLPSRSVSARGRSPPTPSLTSFFSSACAWAALATSAPARTPSEGHSPAKIHALLSKPLRSGVPRGGRVANQEALLDQAHEPV